MRVFLSILFSIYCCQAAGQSRFNASVTDSVLFSTMNRFTLQPTNAEVIQVLQAIDRKYIAIEDTLYAFPSLKHTIVQAVFISYQTLVPAKVATAMILKDTNRYKSRIYDLARFDYDTLRFLQYHLGGHDLPEPYSDRLFPVETELVDPLRIGPVLQTKSILFNNPFLQKLKDSLARRLPKKERVLLNDYLNREYDYCDPRHHRFQAKAVGISYIITGPGTLRYAGIDIYGRHFLWTLDQDKNYEVIKVEGLWVY